MFTTPSLQYRVAYPLLILFLLLLTGCSGGDDAIEEASPPEPSAPTETASEPPEASTPEPVPLDLWWQGIEALCDKAFEGRLVSSDEVDARFAAETMTMHVRRCEAERIEIPFHVGENRSRTWVLTRKAGDGGAAGGTVHLQHDHRHEDGTEDVVTLYGGLSNDEGSAEVQYFPVDEYSKELFKQNELPDSVANTWSFELVPGERFSYVMRRPGRHFQVDFDLKTAVDPPPAPWGHE